MEVISSEQFVVFTSEDTVITVTAGGVGVEQAGAPVAGDAEVSFTIAKHAASVSAGNRRRKLMLWRVEAMRATGASATNYTPQVYNATGAATTAWATKYLGGSTAPGTRFDVTDIEGPMYTDTSGQVFFRVNGDAADTFDFAVWFKVIK